MRLLYASHFPRHYSTELYIEWALRKRDVLVIRHPGRLHFNSLVIAVEKFRTEVVLFSKPPVQEAQLFIDWCRTKGVLTVCWAFDLFLGIERKEVIPPQFRSELLFTTDGGHQKEWSEKGYNHQCLRQGIHEMERHYFPAEPELNVAFVGHRCIYAGRSELTTWLNINYQDGFKIFGNCRGIDLNLQLAKIKVVVGDSYPSPYYWSNRIYEILGRGGFLLHPHTPGLDEEFTDGEHYVGYDRDDRDDLREKIDFYVQHDDDRERIRKQGWRHCSQYTYTRRVIELIRRIKEYSRSKAEPQPLTSP